MQTQLTQQKVTTKQSQSLVHELISVSIYCITFLRNLFEEYNYIDSKYYNEANPKPNANYIRTKKLKLGVDSQADLFIKCIENGIKESIEKEYLKAIQISIYLSKDCPHQVVESYVFGIDYDTNSVSLSGGNCKETFTEDCHSYDSVIAQMQSMLRKLIVMSQSFDFLPNEKHLSIKLLFNNSCPESYQPSYFKDASDLSPSTLKVDTENRLSDLGRVNTGKNQVKLNVFVEDKTTTTDTTVVDPFDYFDDTLVDPLHQDIPASSLHLDTFLKTNEPDPELGVTQSLGAFATNERCCACIKCQQLLNPIEYGYNQPFKRSFSCFKCMFGQLDFDVLLLMKIRKLWNYLLKNKFPDAAEFLKVTDLSIENEDFIASIFNHLFEQNVLLVTNKAMFEPNAIEFLAGSGEFRPFVHGLADSTGKPLLNGQSYFVSFVPSLCQHFPYMSYNKAVDSIYFPNLQLPRANFVSANIRKFKQLKNKSQVAKVPIPSAPKTMIADSQASLEGVITRSKVELKKVVHGMENVTLNNQSATTLTSQRSHTGMKRSASPELSIDSLSFADSLVFLSQHSQQKGNCTAQEMIDSWAVPKKSVEITDAIAKRKKRKISINQ
ncbi:hypothetical protein KGF56_001835 [Candida oxycetoniae]|uniref:HORMA domain-containing protein n=1 Tax=Candida oxycetoniae TaxID=497107 RepID=A0AAI9SY72_9ASCO|nr:uncharacterized protein KGF56_001835 [Candida oxycetoniae]KAI3405338.2 hypothetical protein KGF56_001835 [Candida oxycetoniae]